MAETRARDFANSGYPLVYTSKNVIIGGDFTTNPWQRGTTVVSPANTKYSADRMRHNKIGAGDYTVRQAATPPDGSLISGHYSEHCLEVDVTTADASLDAADLYAVSQFIEGTNSARFGFGQAGTRYVTLSFWHAHTKTGTHCVAITNSGGTRSYVAEYTQSSADAWEKAEITIPVDTTGTYNYDTNIGLQVRWCMAAGSNWQQAAGSWGTGNVFGSANQVNNMDSGTNYFRLAYLQLEAGEVATDFETRDATTELALCQRYYQWGYLSASGAIYSNTSGGWCSHPRVCFPVSMRTTPTLALSSLSYSNCSSAATSNQGFDGFCVYVQTASSTQYTLTGGVWTADAEL